MRSRVAQTVSAVGLAMLVLHASSAAAAPCQVAEGFSAWRDAVEPLAFDAITPLYVYRAFQNTGAPAGEPGAVLQSQQDIPRGMAHAVILVITNENRPAKLLTNVVGDRLLIRKLIVYAPGAGQTFGAPEVVDRARENLRLRFREPLELDPAGQGGAADFWVERRGATMRLRALNAAQTKVLIVLPIVAHRMKSRQEQFASNHPEDNVKLARLRELFNTRGQERSVNAIWASAGILFLLYRIEDCSYSLEDFAASTEDAERARGATEEIVPSPVDDCQRRFRWISAAYNSSAVRGIDLYVWWKLDRSACYGAPHLPGLPSGLGAVWMDGCVAIACGHLLAHELGHFLGLCHTCPSTLVTICRFTRCDEARLPACNDPATNQPMDDLLMRGDNPRSDQSGRPLVRLTAAEVRTARQYAFERILNP